MIILFFLFYFFRLWLENKIVNNECFQTFIYVCACSFQKEQKKQFQTDQDRYYNLLLELYIMGAIEHQRINKISKGYKK